MFDLRLNAKGETYLKFVKRPRMPFERGFWVEIAHESSKEAGYYVDVNRRMGLQVEIDERGTYRALILKD